MEQTPVKHESLEVTLGQLVPAIRGLVRALADTGLGAGELDAVVRHRLSAECLGCGITLRGDDLGHLAIDQDAPADEPSKLNRLRLGYCARSSCESRYYRIRVAETAGLDWPALLARALELAAQGTPASRVVEELEPAESDTPSSHRTARRRLILAGFTLLAAGALWHFWSDLPFHTDPPPKYRIDPSSLPRY